MRNDIFGESTSGKTYYQGPSSCKIVITVLSVVSVIAALVILFNFKLVTALIAMGVAEILTTAIPIIFLFGIIIYIIFRIKWRARRYWW